MWGLIVVHSKQVFHFNCVRFNEVSLYNSTDNIITKLCMYMYIYIISFGNQQIWY